MSSPHGASVPIRSRANIATAPPAAPLHFDAQVYLLLPPAVKGWTPTLLLMHRLNHVWQEP